MHSQPSLFRKVRSEKQRTKIAYMGQYKNYLGCARPQSELGFKSSTLRRQWQMSSLLLKRPKIHAAQI